MTAAVDAHHHYWRVAAQEQSWRTPAHAAIDRDYTPDDLAGELAAAGVGATVLVQSTDGPDENDRLAGYAAATPTVAGVVGWLPLEDPSAARAELDRARTPAWSGVRYLVGRRPLEPLEDPAALALLAELADRGLAWDVVPVTPEQVAAVVRLARAVPGLRVVVDHLARPPLDVGGWEPWAGQLAQLAACPGLAVKLSVGIDVLGGWPAWRPEQLVRYVGEALERFGPARCMVASNWPVSLLRAGYSDVWAGTVAAVEASGASPAELDEVRGGTARRWYALAPAHDGAR